MGEVRLSEHERRVLAEMEERLDRDEPLARRLRTTRPRSRPLPSSPSPAAGARRRLPALGMASLAVVALVLLVLAVTTGSPALVWAFAAVWILTLLAVLGVFVRRARRRAGRGRG
ncbi:DUF3040 domain-containing protein [Streptomyces sp. NPDC088757]|uniref:DUF3040 domain-containing protein n=1 Tax=Streptomyces sp. NPDC088757 TaxID=3365889 RepID=UPI0037FC9976